MRELKECADVIHQTDEKMMRLRREYTALTRSKSPRASGGKLQHKMDALPEDGYNEAAGTEKVCVALAAESHDLKNRAYACYNGQRRTKAVRRQVWKSCLLGDLVQMRKTHPCGSDKWTVIRVGADIKIRCSGCGRIVMMDRADFTKRMKKVLAHATEPIRGTNETD